MARPTERECYSVLGWNGCLIVYPYGGRTAEIWWDKIKGSVTRFENLQVIGFSEEDTGELARLASRSMKLQINIQDGDVMVTMMERLFPHRFRWGPLQTLTWR